jgi:hypothetical protein
VPAFLKTKADEARWDRAKEQAEKAGQAENWAYVTAIYKSMNGGKVAVPLERLAYGKEFLDWTESQTFRNPKTRRTVKFPSLPAAEQARVHRSWSSKKDHGGEEPHREKMHGQLLKWWDQHPNQRSSTRPPEELLDDELVEPTAGTDGRKVYSPSDKGWEVIRAENKRRREQAKTSASRVASRWLLTGR